MALDAFTSALGTSQGRIAPAGWVPPEGSYAYCLGSDAEGVRCSLKVGDYACVDQSADLEWNALLRFRARYRGPAQLPVCVLVLGVTPGFAYAVTVNGVAASYVATASDTTVSLADALCSAVNDAALMPAEARVSGNGDQLQLDAVFPGDDLAVVVNHADLEAATLEWVAEALVEGDEMWGVVVEPGRTRTFDDCGGLVRHYGNFGGSFASLVEFRLRLAGSNSEAAAEVELPALYVDQLVLSESASAFLPSHLYGCKLWLRSDLGVEPNAGSGKVEAWRDQSGAGNDLTQSVDAARPSLAVGEGGRPVVRVGTGVEGLFGSHVPGTSNAYTVVVVAKLLVYPPGIWSSVLFSNGDCPPDNDGSMILHHWTDGRHCVSNFGAVDVNHIADQTPYLRVEARVYRCLFATGLHSYYVNGQAVTLLSAPLAGGAIDSGHCSVGTAWNGSLPGQPADFYEVIFFDRYLYDAELEALHDYLVARYSLSAAFTPSHLYGCKLWLRSDLGVTLAGGFVSAWADQSGSGSNFAQATAGQRPLFVAGAIPWLDFDGYDDNLVHSGAMSSATAYTWMIVIDADTIAGIGVLANHGNAGSTGYFLRWFGATSRRSEHVYWGAASIDGAPTTALEKIVVGHDGATTSPAIWLVNGSPESATSVQPATAATYGASIGGTFGGGYPFDGKIAEVALYDRLLNAGERAALAAYMTARYGS